MIAADPRAVGAGDEARFDLRVGLSSIVLFFALGVLVALGCVFLHFVGRDALEGRNAFQFFADSNTYLQMFREPELSFDGALIGVSANYVGPLAVLRLVGGNIYLVVVVNAAIFFGSVAVISRQARVDPLRFSALLALSPMTISSLLSVNKEIFALPFIALALLAVGRRSLLCAALALGAALLVRWQLAAFWIVMLGAILVAPVIPKRSVLLGLILAAMSLAYLALAETFAPVLAVVERSIADDWDQGSGIFATLLRWQDAGWYLLVFPLKALHLLFALGLRVDRLFAPTNIYNDVFVVLHCAATLALWVGLVRRRAFSVRHDLVYGSIVFLAVFCLSPIYAPRYLYPVYVVWALVLAGAPAALGTLVGRSREPRRAGAPAGPVAPVTRP